VSGQFLNVYLKLQATAQLFHHGSLGRWQWPIDPCKPSKNGDPFDPRPMTHWPISTSAIPLLT